MATSDTGLWSHELFGDADASVRTNFSQRAATISDGLLGASLIAPVVYLTGSTIEDADGDRLMIYGETLAIDALLADFAKHVVHRPRPYRYSHAPDAIRYAESQGDDADVSFYSGHAALSFGAAVAGAYLLGASSGDHAARVLAWTAGMATAAAASNLRVPRHGKRFYSDVLIGGAIGIAIGYAVPALHTQGRPALHPRRHRGRRSDRKLLGGLVISELLPLEHRPDEDNRVTSRVHFAPVQLPHGAGLGVFGAL